MTRTIIGTLESRADAELALLSLKAAGIVPNDMAVIGAGAGSVLSGALGLLSGIRVLENDVGGHNILIAVQVETAAAQATAEKVLRQSGAHAIRAAADPFAENKESPPLTDRRVS
jgi:hypothetical protein